MHAAYGALLADLVTACRCHYGDKLLAVAVYGSVGRGMPRPDSDVDLLIVAKGHSLYLLAAGIRTLRKQIRTMGGADPAHRFSRHSRFFRELPPA